jgi:HD-GYP domain-containing protein (c-di-GMP phosphodiesterase class II)
LFHDLGKAVIPSEVLNKATEFTEEEWRIMRRHPVQGVKLLLKLKGINETTIRMVIGVFEHHLNMDNSGYPKLDRVWSLSLLGRMISLCDCYDALTSSRVYNRVPYTPERALKFMLAKSGTAFDSTLMKIFVNSIGIFPIGTVVLLDTGEMGVVTAISQDPQKAERPKVKLITDPSGNEKSGEVIDLSDKAGTASGYARNVVKTIDPFRYKIDVSRYFL